MRSVWKDLLNKSQGYLNGNLEENEEEFYKVLDEADNLAFKYEG